MPITGEIPSAGRKPSLGLERAARAANQDAHTWHNGSIAATMGRRRPVRGHAGGEMRRLVVPFTAVLLVLSSFALPARTPPRPQFAAQAPVP